MRRPLFFLMACVAAVATFATASVQAIDVVVGTQVFGDDFPGTTLNAQWTPVTANGGGLVVGTDFPGITSAEIYGGSGGNDISHIGTTSALDFSASPNDWWAQVTFLMPVHVGTWVSTNTTGALFQILRGQQTNDPTVFGINQGFDLRAIRYGPQLWALGWYGDDDVFREAAILDDNATAGYAFSDTQRYTVSMHRKSDGMVDIYFDNSTGDGSVSNVIATKSLILGANPGGLTSGDWSLSGGGYILIDKLNVGTGPNLAVPGDYNGNGVVDGADYVVWRKSVGVAPLDNEIDVTSGVGVTDGDDYTAWRGVFGNPTPGSSSGLGNSVVPEPTTAALLAWTAGVLFAAVGVRRRTEFPGLRGSR